MNLAAELHAVISKNMDKHTTAELVGILETIKYYVLRSYEEAKSEGQTETGEPE